MLAKHRSDDSCAACHVKIDPPGFALENFDPAGQWRDKYLRMEGRRRTRGAPVDASYTMADGRHFGSLQEFRQLVLDDPAQLARNVVEKLLISGTGAPAAFADRQGVDAIVREAAESGYGMRTLLHGVVASRIFLEK